MEVAGLLLGFVLIVLVCFVLPLALTGIRR